MQNFVKQVNYFQKTSQIPSKYLQEIIEKYLVFPLGNVKPQSGERNWINICEESSMRIHLN